MQTLLDAFFTWYNIVTVLLCYFIPRTILWKASHNRELLTYIPALCTSFGLLMTFSVLWINLGVNLSSLDLTGQAGIRNVIIQLSNKFSCSLIGILASILWSIHLKIKLGKETREKAQHPWAQKDPQELLWDLVQGQNDANTLSKSANESFKAYYSQIIESLQDNSLQLNMLGEHVQNHFGEAFENLQTLLKNHLDKLGTEALDHSRQNVENIHREFSENTHKLIETYQDGLTKNLDAVLTAVGGLKPSLDDLLVKITQRMEATQEQTEKQAEILREGFNTGTNAMLNNFSEQAGRLEKSFEHINSTFSTLEEKVSGSTQAILDGNLERLQNSFNSIENMRSRSETLLKETTKQFSQSVEIHRQTCDSQQQILEKVEAQLELLDKLQSNASDHFDGWRIQIEEIRDLRNRVSDIANTIDELQQLNQQLALLPTQIKN